MAVTHSQRLRIARYLEDHLHKRFQWGVNDCSTFTFGFLRLLNPSLKPPLELSQYKTKDQAVQVSQRFQPMRWFLQNCKPLKVSLDEALDGDVISWTEDYTRWHVAFGGFAHTPFESGLLKTPLEDFKAIEGVAVWRIV